MTFPQDGEQVKYKTWTYYQYEPSLSSGNVYEDDITTVNIPFHAVRAKLGTEWYNTLFAFDILASMAKSEMFCTRKAVELAWGYIDPLLEIIHEDIDRKVDPWWGLTQNQTSKEDANQKSTFDIFKSGKDSIENVDQYVQWQGNSTLTVWASHTANTVTGTDATQFHPGVTKTDQLVVFVTDAFRYF